MGPFVCTFADLKAEKNEKKDSPEIRIMKLVEKKLQFNIYLQNFQSLVSKLLK